MSNKTKRIFAIIASTLLIILVLLLTIRFIKMLPPFVKIIALLANLGTVYLTVDSVKKYIRRNKKNSKT